MELKRDVVADFLILSISGKLIELDKMILFDSLGLVKKEKKTVILNLSDCEHVDSLGIAQIVSIRRICLDLKKSLFIIHPPEQFMLLLKATHLITWFDIFDDKTGKIKILHASPYVQYYVQSTH